jgi:tetratricopeptide (TPR) repeat protein
MSQHHRSGPSGPADGTPPDDRSAYSDGQAPQPGQAPGQPTGSQLGKSVNPLPPARPTPGKARDRAAGEMDIGRIIHDWDYEPGAINVRKVSGADGKPKLQMRLDLGLLQMELTGRPDGAKPHGCESLLEYYEKKLADHQKSHGSSMGFSMTGDDCQSLREEAVMYYQRYLSLFVLEDFTGVIRDTARNLRVLDLCHQFAEEDDDKFAMEQYRPYITMMNTRAKASIHYREKRYRDALREIDEGLTDIRDFFEQYGQSEAFGKANEVKVLKRFAKEIRRKLPVDPLKRYQRKLDKAVREERYEEAAKLRDRIAAMKGEPEGPKSARA